MPNMKTDQLPDLNMLRRESIYHFDLGRWHARATVSEFSSSRQGGKLQDEKGRSTF